MPSLVRGAPLLPSRRAIFERSSALQVLAAMLDVTRAALQRELSRVGADAAKALKHGGGDAAHAAAIQ